MSQQQILLTDNINSSLKEVTAKNAYDKIFLLTDYNTRDCCAKQLDLQNVYHISIEPNDENKNLSSLQYIWNELSKNGATRKSLLINLGGGMVTDIGGFAAATFKRGISFINVPTTLLAMVDAAVGGKTGINLNHLKNEIGAFANAAVVMIDVSFVQTLDDNNIFSGYAEMLKHGLISNSKHWSELLNFDMNNINFNALQKLIASSIEVKREVVKQDPHEEGIRKALNFGHTFGHAFESFALNHQKPMLHGYAVALGMICELYLSLKKCNFPKDRMIQTINFIKNYYGCFAIDCKQYDELYELMQHDKKNSSGVINFTLLNNIGEVAINQTASKDEIYEAFDFYRDFLGI